MSCLQWDTKSSHPASSISRHVLACLECDVPWKASYGAGVLVDIVLSRFKSEEAKPASLTCLSPPQRSRPAGRISYGAGVLADIVLSRFKSEEARPASLTCL